MQNETSDTLSDMVSCDPFRANRKCSICFIISFVGLAMGISLVFLLDPLINKILAQVR